MQGSSEQYVRNRNQGVETTASNRETILVVEDEAAVRALATTILRKQGYDVLEASHGSEALLVAQNYAGEIHLLLTDVVMPNMGGKELVRQLQEVRPDIRVLYTSGYTDDALLHDGVLEEGIAFLPKPFLPSGLLEKVKSVLTQNERLE
ncbi:MAG TPA: response regulator [Chthonomonadaceae bacterium]|nr:response regulator [Chthonomonadaceae bacterium]